MIIGLTGRNGAGKGTVAQWFIDRGFDYTSCSDAIREDLRERGLEVSRDNLIAGGRRLREEGGPGVLAARILRQIAAGSHAIVDSVRNPAEVEALHARADFVLLEVTADERTRYTRMVARKRGGDSASFEEFQRHEQAELTSTDSAAQQLHTTAALADLQISNDAEIAALHDVLAGLFPTVSQSPAAPHPVDVVITGGAGFVGSYLCRSLLERGERVRCVDIGGFARLGDLRQHPRLDIVVADIRDVPQIVQHATKCIHLAAVVGVDRYIADPLLVLDVNILGTRGLLDACTKHGVPVVIASTSEIYGNWPIDLTEDVGPRLGNLANSRWSYAVSKSAVEQYAHAFGRRGLQFAIARYFNVYGPLLDRPGCGRVLGKFLGCIQQGTPLPLVDGGQAVRSFCHISDAVRGTLALLDGVGNDDADNNVAKIAGRAFNIGRDEPVTIAELARRVVEMTGHTAGTVNESGEQHFGAGFEEIEHRVPDTSALRNAVGFTADTSLDEGLRETLQHWGMLRPDAAPPTPKPLSFVRPQVKPDAQLLHRLGRSLWSGQLTNRGSELRAFEAEMAAFLSADEAMATSSGSGALLMATLALAPRGKAVLPAFTYIATLNAVVWAGLEPVLCDIDPSTWTMCPHDLRRILAEHDDVGLVIPVNVYGVPPDMAAIGKLAAAAGANVLYDNAHGFGSEQDGQRLAGHCDAQVFSLHATKNLPAVEGGAIVTRNPALMTELRRLCNHGLATTLVNSKPGFNFKMSELHASIGRHSLTRLPATIDRRRHYADYLRNAVERTGSFNNQGDQPGAVSNRQNFVITAALTGVGELTDVGRVADSRTLDITALSAKFAALGVGSRRYFWPPLNQLEMYRGRFDLPVTDGICERLLCLPLWSHMSEEQLALVANGITAADAWLQENAP